MTRSVLRAVPRVTAVGCALALALLAGGCLGGSSGPNSDVRDDTPSGPVAPTAFHQTPRAGEYVGFDYESILFEGLILLGTPGNDYSPFKATWIDLTTGVDLCRADGKQGPSCRINPAGEVSLQYPGEGVPRLQSGEHELVFRVYWGESGEDGDYGTFVQDSFKLYVSIDPNPGSTAVYLTWSPSAGPAPITTDTVRLVIDAAQIAEATGDALAYDVEWLRDPPLSGPRRYEGVAGCPAQGEAPVACRLSKDDVCVGDTWRAAVTVRNSQGQASAPLETDPVTVDNTDPSCQRIDPTDAGLCRIGVSGGLGVRAQYHCQIACGDPDNETASCDDQAIHYRFDWVQPGVSAVEPVATFQIEDRGEAVLQGRAEGDPEAQGTALAKGELQCLVWAENAPVGDDDRAGLSAYTCKVRVRNLQPTLGRSCISAFNENFPGTFDQDTVYTCDPDLATLVDPDDDTGDPSLFLYSYAWQRTPLGGTPQDIQITNADLETYPYHCGPDNPSRLARGDTLCCKAVPRNPDTNSEPGGSTGEFGAGEGCCVTVENTPPVFRLPPTMEAVVIADSTTRPTASEETTIACRVPDGSFFDCDNDRAGDFRFQWTVIPPSGGEYALFPGGEAFLPTGVIGPENYNKGDQICCAAVPYDTMAMGLPRRTEDCILVENTPPRVTSLQVTPPSGPKSEPFQCVAAWADPDPQDNLPGRIRTTYTFIVENPAGGRLEVGDRNGDGLLNPDEPPNGLSQGDRIHCCLVVDDTEDASPPACSDSDFGKPPAVVNDGLARIDGVNLVVTAGPDPATVESTLQCRPYGWLDSEGDPEGYRFYWYVNDELELRDPDGQGAKLRSSLTGERFEKGDVVTCRVVTFDGTNVSGNPTDTTNPGLVWSASVTIADACWSVSQVLVAPSEGRNSPDSTFRCDVLGFTDADEADQLNPPTLEYRWYQTTDPRAGLGAPVLGAGGLPVATQTIAGDLLVPNTNDRLVCAVLHPCAGPDERILSANGAQVINTCPRVTSVGLTFTNSNPDQLPLVGDVVTCTPAGWDDAEGETPQYRYEWRLEGSPIPDQTGATLTVTPAMAHRSLGCGAAPVDSYNADCNLTLSPSKAVDNTAPSIETVVYEPPIVYTDTDVVCVPDGWQDPDGDRAGYSFEWLVDGAPVSPDLTGTTTFGGDTLSAAAFRKTQRILCRATPNDGFDDGPTVQDVQLTVRNTLPTIEVSFDYPTPNPERNENLICRFTATDPDEDSVVGAFRWYRNGVLQNLTSTSDLDDAEDVFELDLAPFEPCDRFTCEVIPNDHQEDGLARQAEAQYWGGAALSLSTQTSVVRPPVAGLLADEGTVDWWFRLESGVAGTERTLFAHKPAAAPLDHVSVVIAADGSPGLRLNTTQLAAVGTVVPIGHWVYYALQWKAGSWELYVHVRSADGTTGTWYKVTKAGVSVSAWAPSALRFGAGSLQEATPVGVLDEVRFSSVRRWDPTRGVAFEGGLPVDAPRTFWLPLQGDEWTLALYHITSDGWPGPGEEPPLTDWTPGGETPATYSACVWTRLSQSNECQFLVNVPPPKPVVALRIDSITTTPNPPVNPNYFMHYQLGCDLVEPSVDFNGDEVGYIFRLYQDGSEREAVTLGADEVAAGATGVAFSAQVTINHTSPCPIVTCSVEAFDGALYSEPGEDSETAGYANLEDWNGALNRSFAALGFGCAVGNVCLTNSCIAALGGCVFDPKPGPCNDGDACTAGDQCQSGVCVGRDKCEDANQCTTHTCTVVGGQGICSYEDLAGPCDDGDVCTVSDVCIDGFCVPGYQQNCNDNRTCTQDRCDPAVGCVNDAAVLDGTRCENANQCTFDSECQGGNCIGGTQVSTDDGNQCTIDGCDPASGVYHTPRVGDPCLLTDPCVVDERCQLVGATVACVGAEKDCNDNNVCTSDGCDPSILDGCFHLPNTNTCNDMDPCTQNDFCSGGTCQPGLTPLTCNDSNPCTTDICQYQVGCRFNYNNDPCNDSNACTQSDRCQVGICSGSPISCDDHNPCTLDYCDAALGCQHLNTTNACDDDNECTTDDVCVTGVCTGAPVTCNDNNACTTDTCDGNVGCVFTNNDNNACSDGNPCTDGDRCVDGACAAGLPRDCDDNNVCTFDTCGAAGICEHIAQPGACEDGNLCTTGDQCSGGICRAGTAKNCDDGEFCTIDACNTTTGACGYTNKPPDTACTDGNACTQGDKCIVPAGQTLMVCTPGTPRNCDDTNVCTLDSCDAAGNCTHVNQDDITCDDSNACTTNDRCIDGTCTGAAELSCNDNNPCTADTCDPAVGCVNTPVAIGTGCTDGNPCTTSDTCQLQGGVLRCVGNTLNCDDANACTADFCGAAGTCQHTNLTGSCNDNNSCTTGDSCQSGLCVGGPPATCNDNNPCTSDTCNPSGPPASPCVFTPRPINTVCSDGDPCTLSDKCVDVAGVIVCQGSPNNCNDNNVCTNDVCQADGSCAHQALSAIPCSDNNECTSGDTCQAGSCVGGAAPNCDDGNSCTVDTCEGTVPGGCVHVNQPNNSLCNDNNICTDDDRCVPGGGGAMSCQGTSISCSDSNPCTQDSCNPTTGCTYANSPNGQACDDSNLCTSGTTCTAGVCGGGTTTPCDDGKFCTTDSCDPATGTCLFANKPTGTTCTDGNPCTTGDRCVSGTCTPVGAATPGTPCNDGNACTQTDTCSGTTCVGSGTVVCNDGEPCTQDVCIPETGCSYPAEGDGTGCDDGDACTTGTACAGGVCTGGATVHCNDGFQCTSDTCDPGSGCVYTDLGSSEPCNDGDACTAGDHCDGAGLCLSGEEVCDVCVDLATFDCGNAAADMSLAGNSSAGPADIDVYAGGTCSGTTFAGREATYAVTGTLGSAVEVFWTTTTGGPLAAGYSVRALLDDEGCNPSACVSDVLGGSLKFSTTSGETYYTVLDHTVAGTGTAYRVHARCVDGAACVSSLACDDAARCTMSGQANQMGGSGARYAKAACTGNVDQDFEGLDRVYKFVAPASGDVQVYLTDATGGAPEPDYFAFVLAAGPEPAPPAAPIDCGAINPNSCIASSYDTSTGNSKPVFRFAATVGNVYCIAVDSKDPLLTEQFVLSVGCY